MDRVTRNLQRKIAAQAKQQKPVARADQRDPISYAVEQLFLAGRLTKPDADLWRSGRLTLERGYEILREAASAGAAASEKAFSENLERSLGSSAAASGEGTP